MSNLFEQIAQLKAAIETLEAQRPIIGDVAVDSALKGVQQKLVELEADSISIPQMEGERRQATILFSDLSGYTAMSERLDPEEVEAIMNRVKEAAIRIIESHGGTVNQFIGDEVVALFGIPKAHEDDPCRAIKSALELHTMVSEMSEEVKPLIGQPLTMHSGINTGLIVTAVRDQRDGKFGLTGDTVNTGARILAHAKADEILVSPETQRLIAFDFETEELAAVEMKGKAKAIPLHRIVKAHETSHTTRLPLVGREKEIQRFTEVLHSCLETGKGQALLVSGIAGIGKTRLVEEFRSIATKEGFDCHKGLVLDFGLGQNRDAICSIVLSYLNMNSDSPEKILRSAANKAITQELISHNQLIFLNDLLNLSQPPELQRLYEGMDNESRSLGKQKLIGNILDRVSTIQPILTIIEDTHWADVQTLACLAEMAATVQKSPSILVMTTRPEGEQLDQKWQQSLHGDATISIALSPLDKDAAMMMAGEFFNVSLNLAQKCVERAEGNPLFLEQLLLNTTEGSDESVPGSIQSLILAKLDRLKPIDKLIIQTASILGQRFSLDLVCQLMGVQECDCHNLIEHHLVHPEGDDYLFAHALVQEGVYHSLLKSKRRALHKIAGEWFAESDLELCAEHFKRAKDPRTARAYLTAAKAQIMKFHYTRALPLAEFGLDLAGEKDLKAELTCCKGQILQEIGSTEKSIETYRNALELCDDEPGQVQAILGMVGGMRVLGKYEEGLSFLELAETKATDYRLTKELAKIHHLRGNLYWPLGKIDEVLKHHQRALQYAREASSSELEANAYGGLGDAYYLRCQMKTATDHFERCVSLSHEFGHSRIEAANLSMVGWSCIYLNQFERAFESGTKSSKLAEKINHHRAQIVAHHIVAEVSIEMGNFETAKKEYARAALLEESINTKMWEPQRLHGLGVTELFEGNDSLATSLFEQAEESCRNHGMGFAGPSVFGGLAEVTKDPAKRNKAMAEGETVLQNGCVSHNYLRFYRHAIEACLKSQEWNRVYKYASSLEKYTEVEALPWSSFIIARGRALAEFGKGSRDENLMMKLRDLLNQAFQVGFKLAIPLLEEAVASATDRRI